jgi:hypothetical protein
MIAGMDKRERKWRSWRMVPVWFLLLLATVIFEMRELPYRSWLLAATILSGCAILLHSQRSKPPGSGAP